MIASRRDRRAWGRRLIRLGARALRDPLFQFLVLGFLLFALFGPSGDDSVDRDVRVGAEQVEALRRGFELRRGRAPSPQEQTALVQQYVDEEILVREALALGLDRGDVIVRRRLVQKMEFLMRDLPERAEPTDADLELYLARHPDRYAQPARVTLRHVFVNRQRHAYPDREASRLLEALERGGDPSQSGDPFIAGSVFRLRSERELAAVFGPAFARTVMEVRGGRWTPVPSSYGLHLVSVEERQDARAPALSQLRERLRRDWTRDAEAEAERQTRARLRARYRVEVEPGS